MHKVLVACAWAYGIALVAACAAGLYAHGQDATLSVVALAAIGDITATVVIFWASYVLRNSSMYDPFWSVAPPVLAIFWGISSHDFVNDSRQVFVLLLVTAWAVRLTYNCMERWTGLDHEDWRYTDMQQQTGGLYWLVSFFGIHMFPTALVFASCMPIYVAMAVGYDGFGWLDWFATLVAGTGIWIEWKSDNELRAYLANPDRDPEGFLQTGIWAWRRHPNYLGEILFWWGMFFFGVSARGEYWWWMGIGALLITLMFMFISIPLKDKRMVAKRPTYAEYMGRTRALFPRIGSF